MTLMATMRDTDVLNFIVAGQARSGTAVVQSAIANAAGAVCHANLFHEDKRVRKACHESYFGESKMPEFFIPDMESPHRYLAHSVFDRNKHNEHAVGARIPYEPLERLDLFDFIHERYVEGDFCVVHVVRNPVSCYISLKQAETTKVWQRSLNDKPDSYIPQSVHVNVPEMVAFVRRHEAVQTRLRVACPDAMLVTYKEVLYEFQKTMRAVFDFLELKANRQAVPGSRRLRNRSMRERISNFDYVRASVPHDVRQFMDADDLV